MRFEVIDNFLTKEQWQAQHDLVFSKKFLWSYNPKINDYSTNSDNEASFNNFKSLLFQHWFHGEGKPNSYALPHMMDDNIMFTSASDNPDTKQPYWDIMCQPILDKFPIKKLLNIRTNLYTWWHETDNNSGTHRDYELGQPHLTLIYYINGSNGATWFEGQGKIEKKANRIVIADGKLAHRCIYQTDIEAQIATNINIIV